jgi:hypothetical protein
VPWAEKGREKTSYDPASDVIPALSLYRLIFKPDIVRDIHLKGVED